MGVLPICKNCKHYQAGNCQVRSIRVKEDDTCKYFNRDKNARNPYIKPAKRNKHNANDF